MMMMQGGSMSSMLPLMMLGDGFSSKSMDDVFDSESSENSEFLQMMMMLMSGGSMNSMLPLMMLGDDFNPLFLLSNMMRNGMY